MIRPYVLGFLVDLPSFLFGLALGTVLALLFLACVKLARPWF